MSDTSDPYRGTEGDSLDAALEGLLCEQVDDWKRGTPHPLRTYLDRQPDLRERPAVIVELINQEIVLRQIRGETPRPEDYLVDYPELTQSLLRLFEVHALASAASDQTNGTLVMSPPMQPILPRTRGVNLPEIPGYHIERVLGRGGMGIVYLALHLGLNRNVALKLLQESRHEDPTHVARFRREAEAAARCQHPNLVQIHDFGEHNGEFYLALEYVPGGHLGRALAGEPQPPRKAAELVEILARAIDHAHAQGIVHRDLKPPNILLAADRQPKITDFGLAKLKGTSNPTEVGTMLGTLAYMAPEQVQARAEEIGPRTDIHALGAILYEALTGRPPYRAETPQQILHAILSEEVVSPSGRQPGIPHDLEAICLKCLEKEPSRRYAAASDLAEDLRRFLDGHATAARPVGPAGRFWRWSRRNRRLAGLSAAVVVSLILGTVGSTVLAIRARQAEAATRLQRDRAERARDQAFSAINSIVLTDKDQMLSEELRPYREMLLDEGLRLATEIVREPEYDPRGQLTRAAALMMQAKLLAEKGDRTHAYEVGKSAVELFESSLARNPADTGDRAGLARLLHQLATIATDRESVRSTSRRSCEICEALLRDHPQSEQANHWISLIATNLHNIGNAFVGDCEATSGQARVDLISKAIEAFQESKHLCDEQMEVKNRPDDLLSPLAHSERYLCRAHRSLFGQLQDEVERATNLKRGIEYGRAAVSHFQLLVDRNPEHYQYSWQLQIAQSELGQLFLDQGNDAESAITYYQMSRETCKTIAAKHGKLVSRMAAIQEGLALVDYNLLLAYERSDPIRNAGPMRAVNTELFQICDKLSLVLPLSPVLRKTFASSCLEMVNYQEEDGERPDLELFLKAERLWQEMLREAPTNNEARGMLVMVQRGLADELDVRGRSDDVLRWRGQSLTTARGNPDLFYQLATVYALNARFVGKWPTKLSLAQLGTRRRRFEDEAVAMLREAVADGFKDLGRLCNDPDLAPLRSSPTFQAIVFDLQFPRDPFASP